VSKPNYQVSRELVEALHEQGYHLITQREWYEIQAKLAELTEICDACHKPIPDGDDCFVEETSEVLCSNCWGKRYRVEKVSKS